MRVLITGGTGMIGKYLAHSMCSDSRYEEVVCTTYASSVSSIDSELFFRDRKIKLVQYDVELVNKSSTYDEIWHFATYGQPGRFKDSWEGMVKANSTDIGLLVKKLSEGGHFFYASSSEVYGSVKQASEINLSRECPSGVRGIYTESKLLGEAIIMNILGNRRSTIFRVCLTYAPAFRLNDKRVMYELIIKAIFDGNITLIDDGSAVRQYLYIDDAIEMMLKIRDLRLFDPESLSVFNICNPSFTTIYNIATIIGHFFNVKVELGRGNPHLGALATTEVVPLAYNNTFSPYEYTELEFGISKVCQFAEKHYT